MTDNQFNFDVFLCHNSEDKPAVIKIAQKLRELGILPWFDQWELRPGFSWQKSLEMQIEQIKSAAVFVGKSGVGPWQEMELRAFLEEFVHRGLPVIPVLLPDAPSFVELPVFLRGITWVDFREEDSEEIALRRLIWGITGTNPSSNLIEIESVSSDSLKPATLNEVFRTIGIPDFTYVEPSNYRDVVNDIFERGKHILIYGPSGSGKTCLIRRIFSDLGWKEDDNYQFISSLDDDADQIVKKLLNDSLTGTKTIPIVIDDFHVLTQETRIYLARKLRQLSEKVFKIEEKESISKFILIGISTSPSDLLHGGLDLGRRLGIYKMPFPRSSDLNSLIEQGERKLSIQFSNRDGIVEDSSNSFYICQYLCQRICIESGIKQTLDSTTTLNYPIEDARRHLVTELSERFKPFLISFVQNSGTSRDEWLPFIAIIAVISSLPDSQIALARIVSMSGDLGIAINAMKEKILPSINASAEDGGFRKVFHYSESTKLLSLEDPTLRYYLNHLDINDFIHSVGISPEQSQQILDMTRKIRSIDGRITVNLVTGITMSETRREEVFISYSHADAEWLPKLQTRLKPMIRNKSITVWVDTQIRVGMLWRNEISKAIERAKVAVLLVSPDFLASDFIAENELPPLLDAAQAEGLTIIWIPLSYSSYEETEIEKYQAAHSPRQPIDSLSIAEQNRALVDICKKIKAASLI
ncbi:TIR domain-containing protein [Nostoc sp.]|uniref:TIR domain-containing protein n=1 Tax=Nostoc sp. TaxID=1180 RepID=UPI002FFC0F31